MPIRELSLELVHDIVESYGQITKLNLSTNEISRLENLEYLTCLTSLDLFCNRLGSVPGSLDGLAPLTRLTDLDISENSISSLEPLSSAPASLVRLNVGNNCVERIGQVTFLASLTALAELVLAGNPVAAEEGYWAHTCSTLPSLVALDHTPSPSGTSSPPNAIEEAPALGSSAPLAPLPREDAMMMMSGDQDDGRVERETYPRQEPDRVLERQEPENQSENPPAEPESTLPAPAPSIVSAPAEVPAPAVGSSQGGELLAPAAGDGGEARGIGSRSTEGSAQESSDGATAEGMAAGVLPRADVLGGPAVPHQDGVGLSGSSVAVEAAAAAGLFESPPESVVAPTAPRRFSAESLTEVNDPFQGRVLAPAATNMVPGNDNRAPAVEPAEAAERKRYHQARPDTWLAESETRSRALLPFASGGGRGLGGDGTREAARRTSGVVSPPSPPQRLLGGSSDWNIALEDQRAAGVGVDTPSEGAAVDHHHRGAAPVPGVQPTGRRLELRGSGSLSGDRRRVVAAAAAVSAATTTADRGRIQRNRSGTASDEFSEASESLGRRGPPIFSDRATKHHHDEQHQHHHHHHAAHHHHERHHPAGDGLGLGVADAARSVGDRSKNKGNGLPFEQGRGGVEAPHVPARAAPLEVGRSAASLADRLEGSRPAPGGRLEEITGGEGAMVVVVDRGEWEALRRENEDLRRQVDLSGKRCAALTEMQRLADDALSTSNPPLFSGLVSSSTTAQEVSAERRRLREEGGGGGGGGGGGSLSLSSSSSSSAAGEDEGQFRERSGAGVEKDDGTSGGQGWAASAGEQADVAKLLATWRAEVLKLLLQRGADEEAAAAESREARRKVAEEREAREKAEMEAKSLTQRAIAAEADAELSGIKLARAFEELREDRAGRFAAEASSSGYSASVRSLHDWIEGFVGRASKGFFEREAFLARGVAKLEAFSERLAQAAARIEVLGTLLRHKEVQLRNSRAALAADRRVWLLERRDRELAALSKCSARRPPPPVTSASPSHHKQSLQRPGGGGGGDGGDSRVSPYVRIAPGGLAANSRGGARGGAGGGAWGVVEDEGAAVVQESPLLEGLRPECEAVMRALFCRVDRLGTGAVRALRLLDVLRSDCGVSEVMEAAVGKSRWRAALDSMERALCPPLAGAAGSSDSSGDVGVGGGGSSESGATVPRVERDVTWGEFLLFFLPSAGSADTAYNAGLVHHAGGGNSTGGLPSQTGNSFAGAGAARRQRSAGFGAVSEEAAAMLQMVVPTHWTAGAGGAREERDGEPGTGPRAARGGGAAGGALGRGLAALSVGQLRREVLRLAKERSFLLSLVREDGRLGKRRAEAVHDQYRHELRALHTKIGELERSLEEMSHRTNAEHERGAAVQEELSRLRENMEKSEQEWKRRLDAAVQEKASALAESSREASKAATAARERISRLEAEHSLSLRENGKASVRQRALERELARIKSSMHAEAAVEKEALEERLRAGEAKLATARRERNAMLAALRELQRQSRGHPVSDPVPFFSLTPALGTSRGAGDMLLKDLGDTGGGRGGGGGVGRVIGSSVDSSVGMQEIPQRQAPSSSSPTPAAAAAHESGDASDSEDGPKVVGSKGLGVSELSSGGGRRKEAWQGGGVGRVEREGGGRATSLSARLELLAIQTQQLLEDGSDTSCSSSDDDSG